MYSSKYSGQKIAHHSKQSPSLDSAIADLFKAAKTMVLIVLDQVEILDLQLGQD